VFTRIVLRWWLMSLTVQLPDDLADRLTAEAARRGMSLDDLASEALAERFPAAERASDDPDSLEAFIGSGDSGDPGWAARDTAELRREAARRAG
jgi:predicted transcriptional regulator